MEELFVEVAPPLQLIPQTTDQEDALVWMERSNALVGIEGVVVKARDQRYRAGRTGDWRKIPLRVTQDVLVCGWVPGRGRHTGVFGSLLLGVHDQADGRLRYVGNVGTGFSDRDRAALQALLGERAPARTARSTNRCRRRRPATRTG